MLDMMSQLPRAQDIPLGPQPRNDNSKSSGTASASSNDSNNTNQSRHKELEMSRYRPQYHTSSSSYSSVACSNSSNRSQSLDILETSSDCRSTSTRKQENWPNGRRDENERGFINKPSSDIDKLQLKRNKIRHESLEDSDKFKRQSIRNITTSSTSTSLNQQQQQDGRRTLIKNQLHLIEQLQLENANLRNERDQLQLENEELKFQLQMISSSKPNRATFGNHQTLNASSTLLNRREETGDDDRNKNGSKYALDKSSLPLKTNRIFANIRNETNRYSTSETSLLKDNSNLAINDTVQETGQQTWNLKCRPKSLHATPTRLPAMKLTNNSNNNNNNTGTTEKHKDPFSVAFLAPVSNHMSHSDAYNDPQVLATNATGPVSKVYYETNGNDNSNVSTSNINFINDYNIEDTTKKGSIPFNPLVVAKRRSSSEAMILDPSPGTQGNDDHDLTSNYGDRMISAAIVIQRTFRKYQICKRFRTITEQLRHSSTTAAPTNSTNGAGGQKQPANGQLEELDNGHDVMGKQQDNVNYGHDQKHLIISTNREQHFGPILDKTANSISLSNRLSLAPSNLKSLLDQSEQANIKLLKRDRFEPDTVRRAYSSQQVDKIQASEHEPSVNRDRAHMIDSNQVILSKTTDSDEAVVAAAINFQQLESIRKRQYRVGLNIFNRSPEKGVSFLIAHSFIDASPPQTKTTYNSYYHSNQLHFLDTAKQLSPQKEAPLSSKLKNCNQCLEEDNLMRNVAHFLLNRKGLAKEKIGQYLGNLQSNFNQGVLKFYLQEMNFHGQQVDLALRKFLATFRLPGEAQKIERIVDCFAQRYAECQQRANSNGFNTDQCQDSYELNSQVVKLEQFRGSQQDSSQSEITSKQYHLMMLSKDEIFILTFAIIMLNTDLHSPSLKATSRMSAQQFVHNLRGVFKSQDVGESDLIGIYERVKTNQILTAPDHVTHVMKVQQNLTAPNFQRKEIPNLSVPYRRLVCFCRLFEVYDINKRDRVGQHQREVFLFNDLLLVAKLVRRVRANTTPQYTYRFSVALNGLAVQLFHTTYYNHGIRLYQRSNNNTVLMLNARNELDQTRFGDDLNESIAEMDEMEAIKNRNIVEIIHFKHTEKVRQHSLLHKRLQPIDDTFSIEHRQVDNFLLNNCDKKNQGGQKGSLLVDNYEGGIRDDESGKRTTILVNDHVQLWTKSSSMSNLSSSGGSEGSENERHITAIELPPHVESMNSKSSGLSDETVERKCSAGSVFSLDSGLFLSRDVSPNQSG